ncbi:hypothetical protein H7169_00930 [Candidatus Gracilibacteria bacterium]|nr:hypothetical protein [Candidatus Gracilibacteria bacterium]
MKNIVIIASVLLILASCSQGTKDKNPQVVNPKINTVSGTTYTQDIDSTSAKIRETPEFQSCMKQQATMCIQSTGMQIAQKSKDATFCKELSNADQRSSCEFAITMVNAQEKNDIKLCDSLTDMNYKKQCQLQIYRQEAISKNDITICDKISTLMAPTGTGTNRDNMMQKDQCILQIVMSSKTSSEKDCEKISDTRSVEMCKTMIKNRPMNTIPAAELPNERKN